MSKKTHLHVTEAMQKIIKKCGQILYQSYLTQKLPSNCNQKVIANVQTSFNIMNNPRPIKNQINRQVMPRPASVDIIAPNRIIIKNKPTPQLQNCKSSNKILFATEIMTQNQACSYRSLPRSNKPNFCIKYSCNKGDIDKNQQIIRKQKIQSQRLLLKTANKNRQNQEKAQYQKKNLQMKIKQLLVEGIPYTYDDQGNLNIPDIKTYKKQIENQNKIKRKKSEHPFSLRYKALQYLTQSSLLQNNSQITGKKKGFSNTKVQKKRKINDEDFNNQNQRQCSAIPFMNVEDGVKIVQKQRNIMAQKLHRPHTSREVYVKQSHKSNFKSFLPFSQYNSIGNPNSDRPFTHSFSRVRQNSGSLGLASASSLSARPKTSMDKNRISINNKGLAIQMVKEQTLLARKLII